MVATRGAFDERGIAATLQSIANSRSTMDMFGSGYYEMLARQISADLQSIRDRLQPGQRAQLKSKGVSFGVLARNPEGSWNTTAVEGIPQSPASSDAQHPPSLLILPFHQAASIVSLRVFTNDAFNQHHGYAIYRGFRRRNPSRRRRSCERINSCRHYCRYALPRHASRARPHAFRSPRASPSRPPRRAALSTDRLRFLPHPRAPTGQPWLGFTEPNPYNPTGNLQLGDAPTLSVDLASDELPQPRLKPVNGVVMVPLYTDFKLHDICKGPDDPNIEPLNANQKAGSPLRR